MTQRTIQFRGSALGKSLSDITVHYDNKMVWSGPVIDSRPSSDLSAALFDFLVPLDCFGTKPMSIIANKGTVALSQVYADRWPKPNPKITDDIKKILSGCEFTYQEKLCALLDLTPVGKKVSLFSQAVNPLPPQLLKEHDVWFYQLSHKQEFLMLSTNECRHKVYVNTKFQPIEPADSNAGTRIWKLVAGDTMTFDFEIPKQADLW